MAKYDKRDEEEKKSDAEFFANRICAAPMCQLSASAKNNVHGGGRWFCPEHSLNPNAIVHSKPQEVDWRREKIHAERVANRDREKQPDETSREFGERSLQFMRENIGKIGSC